MKKFTFKKSYEEVEAGGEIYRVDLSDDKIKEYQKEFQRLQKEITDLNKVDTDKMSEKQGLEHFDNMIDVVKRSTDFIFGKGSFEKLYEASGRSAINVADFLFYVAEIVRDYAQKNREDKLEKYVKK